MIIALLASVALALTPGQSPTTRPAAPPPATATASAPATPSAPAPLTDHEQHELHQKRAIALERIAAIQGDCEVVRGRYQTARTDAGIRLNWLSRFGEDSLVRRALDENEGRMARALGEAQADGDLLNKLRTELGGFDKRLGVTTPAPDDGPYIFPALPTEFWVCFPKGAEPPK